MALTTVKGSVDQVLDTIADLQALSSDTGTRVEILGHTTIGDGGEGVFYRDDADTTSVDNNGTIIVDNLGKRWKRLYSGIINVKWFGAVGDNVADDTVAIQTAIDTVAGSTREGGIVYVDAGKYKTTATITLYDGITLLGAGRSKENEAALDLGATTFIGTHTGAAVISLKGTINCKLSNFAIESDTTTYPKTGLLLGRDSSASAGHHYFEFIKIQGKFSQAAIYSIASEVNTWIDVYVWNLAGAGKYGFYTSASDDLSVDTLTTSTNLVQDLTSLYVVNASTDADAACIYMALSESMGSWNFYNAYLIPYAGSYVQMHNTTDSQVLGPISFYGGSGERLSGGDPTYGFKISSDVSLSFKGFTAIGCRFDFQAGATHYTINIDSNTTLFTPNVVLQVPEAFPYALATYTRTNIKGGIFKVGREYEWTAVTLAGAWVNEFGSPYVQAEYTVDGEGRVKLRGRVTTGTGTITTLPTNYRPSNDMFFFQGSNILLLTSAGVLSLFSGTAPVDLGIVNFVAEN